MKLARVVKCQTAVLFLVLILSGVSKSAYAENTDAFLTQFINTLNASMPPNNNPAAVANLFEPDSAVYYMNPGVPTQKGRSAIRNYFTSYSVWFSDWTHVERSRLIQGNRAVWEGTEQGHDKSTGKPLKVPVVFILEFDDQGLVKESRVYIDVQLIADQLK
jgi:ketosteroid isomerase-like protein